MDKVIRYLKVAICDSNTENVMWMEEMFEQLGKQENVRITVDTMKTEIRLVQKTLANEHYDIVCMCIDRKEEFKKTAEILRSINQKFTFFFLSKDTAKAKETYEFCPAAYLEYPLNEEEFTRSFIKTMERITDPRRYFVFNFDHQTYYIEYKKIQYMESNGHSVEIKADNRWYRIFGRLDDIEQSLNKHCPIFIRTHKSYLINYNQIHRVKGKIVELMQGEQIPVSNSFTQNMKAKYSEYTRSLNWTVHVNM